MKAVEAYGRRLLRLIAAAPRNCRGYSGRQIAADSGLSESSVSLALTQASELGYIVRTRGRRRQIWITPEGLEWMATEQPQTHERVDTVAKRKRILLTVLRVGMWAHDIERSGAVTPLHSSYMLERLRECGLIYRAFDGWRTSAQGRAWLTDHGVKLDPPKQSRICLMCDQAAAAGRWYCELHINYRSAVLRRNDDGSYCPGSAAGAAL